LKVKLAVRDTKRLSQLLADYARVMFDIEAYMRVRGPDGAEFKKQILKVLLSRYNYIRRKLIKETSKEESKW